MPAICPDGSVIAVATRAAGRLRSLWHFRAGEEPTPIVAPRAGRAISWPRVSPDGRFVAYVDSPGGPPAADAPAALAVMSLSGGSPRVLAPDDQRVGPPGWSTDGARVLFSARTPDSAGRDVYSVPVGGGTPERVTDDEGDEDFPFAWYGEDAILYVSRRRLPIEAEFGPVDGGARAPLPPLPPEAIGPSPSRDGSLLLWVVPAGPEAGVWVRTASGETPWAIHRGPTAPTPPSFLADGRHVAFLAPTAEGIDLFVVSVDGGEAVRSSYDGLARTDSPPAPSPGGTEIAWMIDDGSRAVVVGAMGGGGRRLVARDVRAFSWDPSGAFLLVRDVDQMPVLSLSRGGSETVVPGLADSTWRPIRATDDGRSILVLERSDHPRLLAVRVSDGHPAPVLDLPPDVDTARASVAVDPTGRWVLQMLAHAHTEVRLRRFRSPGSRRP
jgi:Tol biopolymer transport system component